LGTYKEIALQLIKKTLDNQYKSLAHLHLLFHPYKHQLRSDPSSSKITFKDYLTYISIFFGQAPLFSLCGGIKCYRTAKGPLWYKSMGVGIGIFYGWMI
jgi:hypothetical protein